MEKWNIVLAEKPLHGKYQTADDPLPTITNARRAMAEFEAFERELVGEGGEEEGGQEPNGQPQHPAGPVTSGAAFYEGPSGSGNRGSGSGSGNRIDRDAEIRTVAREESEAIEAAIQASLDDRQHRA